jgi:hypothetical protein
MNPEIGQMASVIVDIHRRPGNEEKGLNLTSHVCQRRLVGILSNKKLASPPGPEVLASNDANSFE